jgi:hypothetical protein
MTSSSPPQSENIKKIKDFTTSKDLINNIEYFIRNIAALGQCTFSSRTYLASFGLLINEIDFSETNTVFHDTAERVQRLLAEVTPDSPINPSLPTAFNDWLRTLLTHYPSGCT